MTAAMAGTMTSAVAGTMTSVVVGRMISRLRCGRCEDGETSSDGEDGDELVHKEFFGFELLPPKSGIGV